MTYLMMAALAIAAFAIGPILSATQRRRDREIIEAAREVALCPTVNSLSALKTAIQLNDEGLL